MGATLTIILLILAFYLLLSLYLLIDLLGQYVLRKWKERMGVKL